MTANVRSNDPETAQSGAEVDMTDLRAAVFYGLKEMKQGTAVQVASKVWGIEAQAWRKAQKPEPTLKQFMEMTAEAALPPEISFSRLDALRRRVPELWQMNVAHICGIDGRSYIYKPGPKLFEVVLVNGDIYEFAQVDSPYKLRFQVRTDALPPGVVGAKLWHRYSFTPTCPIKHRKLLTPDDCPGAFRSNGALKMAMVSG